ncbi:MAG: hypothetical protein SPD91_00180 [Streptococcus hyointestinalis]|uniref:hypothetical protein n=1 Tax=Streptococcus hyointestinalis TaxID=1337 RepID=UPI002A812B1D|nr:hypothetical protein [Streptococcus hyointestinalis]MDY4552879.1 hypothetical protein [Streptococcus hyointestinalis]
MLKINKTRRITASFFVTENGEEKLVKQTTIDINNEAVSTLYENLLLPDLYAKNRTAMRKNEQKLRDMRYEIEDAVLAEAEADKAKESD